MQHLRLEGLQVTPCLPLTDGKSADPAFLAVQSDDRDPLVNPVMIGGNDEVVVMTGRNKRLGFLVEDPVVVAVMNCRKGDDPAGPGGIRHQERSRSPAFNNTVATLRAALPSP